MGDEKEHVDFIKCSPNEVEVYMPSGHAGTFNRRLIGWSSGARYMEVILGEMDSSGVAEKHVHNDFEQALYMLEGVLRIESNDRVEKLEEGDLVFFPMGVEHKVECLTEKARFLVIYSPPKEKFDSE